MKAVKLTKNDLKDLAKLLTKVGAVHGKQAFPSHVYCSKEDSKTMRKFLTDAFKKEYPYLNSRKIQTSVGMTWLNLGPNESLEDVIRPGYVLVDIESISKEIKSEQVG